MERLGHVNRSGVVRRAIMGVLEAEEGRSLARAVLLNEKVRKRVPEGWSSVAAIRYWREHRYGRVVGDASVMVKWFIEEDSDKALKLRDMRVNGELP